MTIDARGIAGGLVAPRRMLSAHAEAELSPRSREALDQLEEVFLVEGFASLTVRDLAARLRTSLRTLYEIADSKQQLVLVVVDRFLHRVGRNALSQIDPVAPVADRIRAYFGGGAELQRWTRAFAADAAGMPEMLRLLDSHFAFVSAMVERLVAEGVATGEMRPVDPVVAAAVLSGAASHVTRATVGTTPESTDAIDQLIDIVLYGLSA